MHQQDLLDAETLAAFGDSLRPTGSSDTASRMRAFAKRHVEEMAREEEAAGGGRVPDPATLLRDMVDEPGDYRGTLDTPAKLRSYVLGGRGRLTLVSRRTGQRFTFKIGRPRRPDDSRLFARLLTGSDNESDYTFIGTLFLQPFHTHRGLTYPPRFKHSRKSHIGERAPGVRAAAWLFDRVLRGSDEAIRALLAQAEVWHEGVCGRCGRSLTVPESIETGIGPVCAEKGA